MPSMPANTWSCSCVYLCFGFCESFSYVLIAVRASVSEHKYVLSFRYRHKCGISSIESISVLKIGSDWEFLVAQLVGSTKSPHFVLTWGWNTERTTALLPIENSVTLNSSGTHWNSWATMQESVRSTMRQLCCHISSIENHIMFQLSTYNNILLWSKINFAWIFIENPLYPEGIS